jgi:hypothetical protein
MMHRPKTKFQRRAWLLPPAKALKSRNAMNPTTRTWAGAGLVLVALVASVREGMFAIACAFGISIILIGVGLIANGLEESYDDE